LSVFFFSVSKSSFHCSFDRVLSHTMRASLICIVAPVVVAKSSSAFANSKRAFLASDLQPEVVAHTLLKVEDEWRAQAASFAECNATLSTGDLSECNSATNAFQKSCFTVVEAVVKASNGDRSHVQEYMGIVCGETELSGWHQERCSELSQSVFAAMSDDNYENRESFNVANLCTGFWSRFTIEEKARVDQEREEREVAERKAEEERVDAEKKAAALAAEEQKRLEKEEAEAKAQEAKRKAEEAAEALKAKKEEAERQAEDAKHKMEEAQAAAEAAAKHHQEVLANATAMAKAENATIVAENATIVASVAAANVTNTSANTTLATNTSVSLNTSTPQNVSANASKVNATLK